MPPGAKSMRERDTPSVLSPGIFSTLAPVTSEPKMLSAALGLANMSEKKSDAFTLDAGLHVKPLTFTAVNHKIHRIS